MNDPNASEQASNGPKCIEIPRGWSRILENGCILYISPNNSRLRSLDRVVEYLKTEGTCKCGLECPLFIHKVFNFDARIPSKLIPVNSRQEPSQSGCKHCVIDYLEGQQPSETAVKQANDIKLPPFSTLSQKRGPGRPRNPVAKSRKVGIRKHDLDRPTSPLHNIPLPVPSSIVNSPVQSVPTNIAVEQGPLPSFATIVSSSKLFNPGAGLGNTLLSSSTVTSAVNSSPITATSLQSSKTVVASSGIAVSSSATLTSQVSTAKQVTEASKTTAAVTSTVVISQQHATVVPASLPLKSPPGVTVTKCLSTSGLSMSSTSLTTSAPSRNDPSNATIVSSTTTSVVSTSVTTMPATKQAVKSDANVSKLPDAKASSKVAAPRTSKSSKSYGPRKTVAATLKAAAAARVCPVSSETTGVEINSPLQRTQAVTTSATVPSSEKATVSNSKPSSQVVPIPFVTTTVQAPALFHSVLKDAIIKEQGHVVSSPSTFTTTVPGTSTVHATPSHGSKGAQPASSTPSRSKSAVTKEITQATTALVQSVKASHATPAATPAATPTVPQHVPAHRPQPPVKAGSSLSGQTSLAINTSQQQSVQAASTVAQSAAQMPASSYGQVKNTAASSQVPSMQIAASQAQAGVFFQGNGNQVFQMNVDSSQLKGAYQLHGALYQGAIPATFLATANANKATSPNSPAGIPQAMYPTNPYMLGIVMPTAITQPNQSGQPVATTATSPSATAPAVATAAPVASYSYNNQNAAIAAAFESFVPIAPAASPRFSQTLAHLASAYSPFLPRGAVQGSAPMQFAAQRMVPMSTMHSQTGGNGQLAPTVLNLGDYAVKYPLNTVKPGSYNPQPSTASSTGQVNTHPQTAVVAAMPYVAFGQINHPRFPFSVNFAAPSVSTNPSVTSSSPSPSCSFVTSGTTPHQYGAGTNTDSHSGAAVLGYVTMPFNTHPGGVSHPLSAPNPHPGSAFSPPSSHASASHGNQRTDVPGLTQHLPSWCSSTKATNKRRCSTPESSSSGCSTVTSSCSSFSVPSSRSSCMEVSASSGTVSRSSSCSQSPRHASVTSPLNSPLPMPLPNQGLSACRGSPKGDSPLACNTSGVEGMPSRIQSFNVVESHQVKTSSSEMTGSLKRTYNDSSEQTKKTKYDESAYYEANPLLGLKRSCEAIEAYCSPERDDNDDDDDDYMDERSVSKNEESSPENNQSGEGNLNSKNCGNLNSCSDINNRTRGINSRGVHSVPVNNEPISSKRQSHSVYNGDVSPSPNEAARVQMVNQDVYLPVKTNPLSSNTADNQACMYEPAIPITRPQFDIGDIVWAQARGLPSWPGKVVDASEVGKGRPDDGKRWVMWFGDHTFSQVEVDRLKTLSDGLRTLDDKARKKKYKAKKVRISLEQAISEALEALEVRERLRGRQTARSKTKKKRIR